MSLLSTKASSLSDSSSLESTTDLNESELESILKLSDLDLIIVGGLIILGGVDSSPCDGVRCQFALFSELADRTSEQK